MKWFRNFKISVKLVIGFVCAVLLLAIVGIFGVWGSGEIYKKLELALNERLPALDYLVESDRDLQQLLVAERSMIFENASSERFKTLVADYEENLKQSRERMAKYEAMVLTPEEKTILGKYKKDRKAWEELSLQVKQGRQEDTRQGRRLAIDLTLNQANAAFGKMRDHLNTLQELTLKIIQDTREASKNVYNRTLWVSVLLTALGIAVVIFFLFLLRSTISHPVKEMLERTRDMAEGTADLTRRLQVATTDEIGMLAEAFNRWIDRLHGIINQVKIGSIQMLGTAVEIATGSQDLAGRTNQQAAAVTEATATLEEFATIMKENGRNVEAAIGNITKLNVEVMSKQELIKNVTSTMNEIDSSSKQIGNIMNVINDISFQTNLLALNAAVEAARAGEAGRGFAVVAAEVRNLAQKTADSSKTIQEIVSANVQSTERGMELVKETEAFFSSIVSVLSDLSDTVSSVESANKEQETGMDQINETVVQLESVTNQNAQLVSDFADVGKKMDTNAGNLQTLMEEFRTDTSATFNTEEKFANLSAPIPNEPEMIKAKSQAAPDDFFGSEEEGYEEF